MTPEQRSGLKALAICWFGAVQESAHDARQREIRFDSALDSLLAEARADERAKLRIGHVAREDRRLTVDEQLELWRAVDAWRTNVAASGAVEAFVERLLADNCGDCGHGRAQHVGNTCMMCPDEDDCCEFFLRADERRKAAPRVDREAWMLEFGRLLDEFRAFRGITSEHEVVAGRKISAHLAKLWEEQAPVEPPAVRPMTPGETMYFTARAALHQENMGTVEALEMAAGDVESLRSVTCGHKKAEAFRKQACGG